MAAVAMVTCFGETGTDVMFTDVTKVKLNAVAFAADEGTVEAVPVCSRPPTVGVCVVATTTLAVVFDAAPVLAALAEVLADALV